MKIDLYNAKTAAQAMTTIGYSDDDGVRSLDFRVKTENAEDLINCVQIIKAYNEFDWAIVEAAIRNTGTRKRFYNEGNPNNGSDLFDYFIGREGSPVMYINYFNWSSINVINADGSIVEYKEEDFKKDMETLAMSAKADECHFEDTGSGFGCRLWWD